MAIGRAIVPLFAAALCVGAMPAVAQSAAVVEGASYGPRVAPGGIVSIFGTGFAASTESAAAVPLPTRLAGVSANVQGIDMPLFFVSPTQINAQLPLEVAPGEHQVRVTRADGSQVTVLARVAASAPGVFTDDSTGRHRTLVLKPDFSGAYRPTPVPVGTDRVAPGDIVILYVNGLGRPSAGSLATGAGAAGLVRVPSPTIRIGGRSAEILFAGYAPGLVGVNQINLRVPEGVSGREPLEVCSGDGCVATAQWIETNCADRSIDTPLGPQTLIGGLMLNQWLGAPRPETLASPVYGIPVETNGFHRSDIDCKYRVRLEWIDRSWDNALRTFREGNPGRAAPRAEDIVNKATVRSTLGFAANSGDQGASFYRAAVRTCSAQERVAGRGGYCVEDTVFYRNSFGDEANLCQGAFTLEMVKGIGQWLGLNHPVRIQRTNGTFANVPCHSVLADYVGWDCRPNASTARPVNLGNACTAQ